MNNTDEPIIIGHTPLEADDVSQQLALLRLENPGKKYSRRIVRQKMALENREPSVDYTSSEQFRPWTGPQESDGGPATEQLINWALELNDPTVSTLLFSFLENPAEELTQVIRELSNLGYISPPPSRKSKADPTAATLANLLWRALPATKDELIRLISQSSFTTERPAATVRQWIRRYERKGSLRKDSHDDKYYDNRRS